MFTVTIDHRNPSRDNEYFRQMECDGYVLVTCTDESISFFADGVMVDSNVIRKAIEDEVNAKNV